MPNSKEIRVMARELGIKGYSKLRKEELIRAIQAAEGNASCFNRIPDCGIQECLWRADCLPSR